MPPGTSCNAVVRTILKMNVPGARMNPAGVPARRLDRRRRDVALHRRGAAERENGLGVRSRVQPCARASDDARANPRATRLNGSVRPRLMARDQSSGGNAGSPRRTRTGARRPGTPPRSDLVLLLERCQCPLRRRLEPAIRRTRVEAHPGQLLLRVDDDRLLVGLVLLAVEAHHETLRGASLFPPRSPRPGAHRARRRSAIAGCWSPDPPMRARTSSPTRHPPSLSPLAGLSSTRIFD